MDVFDAMEGITFGCDPEAFIRNTETGEYVCPDDIIPGTKAEPYPVPGGFVQQDGMAAEFNIHPVTNFEDFRSNIKTVVKELKKFLPDKHELVFTPSAEFTEREWERASDKAKALGCSPDFNAWTGQVNPPPEDLENPYMRCAGGHIHVGWTEDADMNNLQHVMACRDLVKQLDWYLAGWSVRKDKDKNRRRLYGKAGSMRFKSYGVEYRTLSNFWLTSPARIKETWNRMNAAIWGMRDNYLPDIAMKYTFGGLSGNEALIHSIDSSTRNSLLEDKFSFPITQY